MTDMEKSIEVIDGFLKNNEQRFLLLKGVDDENKIKVTMYCINNSGLKKGLIRISNKVNDIPRILKRMGVINPKSRYKFNQYYKIGNLVIKFDSYTSKYTMKTYNESFDFAVIYPVQSIANRIAEHDWFIEMINEINSKKIILVTTNDILCNFDWLEGKMDLVYSYDSKNDKPELYNRVMRWADNEKKRREILRNM